MAASTFRSIWVVSKRNQLFHPRHCVLINSVCQFKIESNNYSQASTKSKSRNNFFLTYKFVIFGALGLGFTFFQLKDEIPSRLWSYALKIVPTLHAKSKILTDISENRNKYNFIADVVEISAPSVVYIEIKDQKRMDFFTGSSATTSNGSGFIVKEDGLILTNAHVVVNKPNTLVKVRLQDGSTYVGRVEDVDLQSDLATVRIEKNNLPVMKLGTSASLRPGEFVVAIGSPLTLSNTVTSGVVSSANRQSEELGLHHKHMGYIQTDAAITFGNSGGPLVNLSGEAIGINAMKVTAGISFAIPIDYAKEFLAKAEERRKNQNAAGLKSADEHPRRRFLGITMLSLTPSILKELQERSDQIPSNISHGVLVWRVIPGSPAHHGGLKAGDIVTHVNDVPVIEASNIYGLLEKPGALSMTIHRGAKVHQIRIDPEEI